MHNTVVPKARAVTETEFRAAWLVTLSRLCRQHGDGEVALRLGVSERHLRNVKAGTALPTADKLWNLLSLDDSAHDELDGLFGAKKVAQDSICSNDPLTLDMISVAQEVAAAEAPDSHGGVAVTDPELRKKDEARLRRVHRTLGGWIARLDAMRGVKLVAVEGSVR